MKALLTNKKTYLVGIPLIVLLLFIIFAVNNLPKEKNFYLQNDKIEFTEVVLDVNQEVTMRDVLREYKLAIIKDYVIDTKSIGRKEYDIKFIYEKEKYYDTIVVNVVDREKPRIYGKDSYTVERGDKIDLINTILSGDDYDDMPKRRIIGEYDTNVIGTYHLTYEIEDSSGNIARKDFDLNVIRNQDSSTNNTKPKKEFADILQKYKTEQTEIGIDVSKWQGTIDFAKVKKAGCEFVIIRLGHQNGFDGDLIIDPNFETNIKNAKAAGLKVGVYLYTYAKSEEEALKQAKWAISHVQNYELDLGISYDWESWSNFNKINLSFKRFSQVADTFLTYVSDHNYQGMLYSSKNYLENVWYELPHNTWLAHYTDKTNYEGKYSVWQMCNNGHIDGIDGNVDIDILYKNE